MAKYTTSPAISRPKNPDTASRKKYSASTRPAMVEAPSGNNGVPLHIWLTTPPGQHEDHGAQREHRRERRNLNDPHNREAVTARRQVVVVAVEQHALDRRGNLAGACVENCEPKIARTVIDAEEVARDMSVGRQHHHARGMGEL